ncbi:MAG: hypothetical protein WBD81_17910 [Collimonas pratensis]|uniref:hypothetical protein n=1 Tax=Collimonas pratensis TaxID=279113 RepID=UPI003C782374
MKRRTFIQSILGAVASLALAQTVALKKMEVAVKGWIPNPAYHTAQFEVSYIWHPEAFCTVTGNQEECAALALHLRAQGTSLPSELPQRYEWINGEFVEVSPHLFVE